MQKDSIFWTPCIPQFAGSGTIKARYLLRIINLLCFLATSVNCYILWTRIKMDQNFTEEFTCKPNWEPEGNGIWFQSKHLTNTWTHHNICITIAKNPNSAFLTRAHHADAHCFHHHSHQASGRVRRREKLNLAMKGYRNINFLFVLKPNSPSL